MATLQEGVVSNKMAETSATVLREGILRVLECPVCYDHMEAPIVQCSAGHSMCTSCSGRIKQCPVCRMSIQPSVRNYSLEKISEQFRIPCPNRRHGCKERMLAKHMPKHRNSCPYEIYNCPLSMDNYIQCGWKGSYKDILDHAKETHPSNTFNGKDKSLRFDYNFNGDYLHLVSIIYKDCDLFARHYIFDNAIKKSWTVILYLGCALNACKFQYHITFRAKDNSICESFTRTVHSEDEDIGQIIENDSCFTISEQRAQLYTKQGGDESLANRLEIKPSSLL